MVSIPRHAVAVSRLLTTTPLSEIAEWFLEKKNLKLGLTRKL